MDKIKEIINKIENIDTELLTKTQKRLDSLTKPQGSLGKLEELAKQIVGVTGKDNPQLKNKVIFTLAADHGVTEENISAFPKEVTAQMVYNFLRGGAGVNVLANHAEAKVVVVDMGICEEIQNSKGKMQNFKNKKIAAGTKNMAKGAAMSMDEAVKAIEAGIEVFEEEFNKGIDIVGTGDMGIGNTTSSSAITAVITGQDVETVTGRGTGIGDEALKHKIEVIIQAIQVNKPDPKDAIDILTKVGGFEIAGLVGVILAASSNRVPVIIDGFISGAAGLVAFLLEPKVKDYLVASHLSQEKGHKILLDYIGIKPILDLDLRLGEGTGSALALNIIEASVKILTEMATFENANVSEKTI